MVPSVAKLFDTLSDDGVFHAGPAHSLRLLLALRAALHMRREFSPLFARAFDRSAPVILLDLAALGAVVRRASPRLPWLSEGRAGDLRLLQSVPPVAHGIIGAARQHRRDLPPPAPRAAHAIHHHLVLEQRPLLAVAVRVVALRVVSRLVVARLVGREACRRAAVARPAAAAARSTVARTPASSAFGRLALSPLDGASQVRGEYSWRVQLQLGEPRRLVVV
mmetsp:Transcript_17603/g.40354  ORF Transcript_17603/g.40354 Transcript_17603/m.40354 type:complete len:221 (+) Transcript_17603:783-1445(+)